MIHGKKGIELSINFLVIMILGVVMLSLGIWLLSTFFESVTTFEQAVSEREREQMLVLIGTEDLVLQPTNLNIRGGKDDSVLVALHSRVPGRADFNPEAKFEYYTNKDGDIGCTRDDLGSCPPVPAPASSNPNTWLIQPLSLTIRNTDTEVFKVPVLIPKGVKAGVYTYSVCVEDPSPTFAATTNCDTGTDIYGNKKIYFHVKVI